MSNPSRFWATLVGGYAIVFGAIDLACAKGPANGDTFSECLGAKLDTPTKRAVAVTTWLWFAVVWLPRHILKDRSS